LGRSAWCRSTRSADLVIFNADSDESAILAGDPGHGEVIKVFGK